MRDCVSIRSKIPPRLFAATALVLVAVGAGAAFALPAGSADPARHVVTNPDWLRRPVGEDLARYYPEAAARRNVEGRAVIACLVTAQGRLDPCHVEEEAPTGYGFGDAAVNLSHFFAMRPMTVDGTPVSGGRIVIPIRFRLPDETRPARPNFAFDPILSLSTVLAAFGLFLAAAVLPETLRSRGGAQAMGALVEDARAPAWAWTAMAAGMGAAMALSPTLISRSHVDAGAGALSWPEMRGVGMSVLLAGVVASLLASLALRARLAALRRLGAPMEPMPKGRVTFRFLWLGGHRVAADGSVDALVIVMRAANLTYFAGAALYLAATILNAVTSR
jgi:TonB family protein